MNITSVASSPYSNYPSPLSKAQGQKDSGAAADQATPASAGDKKNPAESASAKPALSKQDSAKSAQTQKQIDELKKIDSHVRAEAARQPLQRYDRLGFAHRLARVRATSAGTPGLSSFAASPTMATLTA